MFPVAILLIAMGYTIVYYGGSISKAYKAVHDNNLTPDAKGGIPFGVLLGVNTTPRIGTGQDNLGQGQAFPPFITGTENHRPKGDK